MKENNIKELEEFIKIVKDNNSLQLMSNVLLLLKEKDFLSSKGNIFCDEFATYCWHRKDNLERWI